MTMPGRTYSSDSYRYGFNGQEKVDELDPSHTTAMFWEYDGRLGRRWNLDPKSQTSISNYACFKNNPILYSDINGDAGGNNNTPKTNIIIVVKSSDEIQKNYSNSNGKTMGSYYIIVADDIEKASTALQTYMGDTKADNVVLSLHGVVSFDESGRELDTRSLLTSPETGKSIGSSDIEKQTDVAPDVTSLKGIMNSVKDDGNFILTSCQAGDDEDLLLSVSDLNPKITTYMNKDNTPFQTVDGVLQVWTGETPLSEKNNGKNGTEEGWLKMKDEVPYAITKGDDYSPSSIYLDSRENKSPVNEIK